MKVMDRLLNTTAMELLSDVKPCNQPAAVTESGCTWLDIDMISEALDRGIDALYMQNKIIDAIQSMKAKKCFCTDSEGVVKLLSSFLVASQETA